MSRKNLSIAIIGGGPAGLKAAEVAAKTGAHVTLYEAKRSVGRKFLIAGKSGLNLTSDADQEDFIQSYSGSQMPSNTWQSLLSEFSNTHTRQWAQNLGVPTFVSSAQKVFPEKMKAAPLLRKWVLSLKNLGVEFLVNHTLTEISAKVPHALSFNTPDGKVTKTHDKIILALGGGSWPDSGSTGKWISLLDQLGVKTIPLTAANCGWEIDWPPQLLTQAEGLPIKNVCFHSGKKSLSGESVITRYGMEGGPIYRLGPQIRQTGSFSIDLKPTFSEEQLLKKMESAKRNLLAEAEQRWKLHPASIALLEHYHQAENCTKEQLAHLVKNCILTCRNPRPIEEAISSAGGICWSELDPFLRLKKHPTISVAGEMIDWEAPTGGFLLQGCFATGKRAASGATSMNHK